MLNEEKIRLMTKIARYEEGEGKKYLPISRYYRSDYIGLALIKNFFLIAIAYLLIVALIIGANLEYILDHTQKLNLVAIATVLIGGYAILLVLYTVITYVYYSVKYAKSKKSVKEYDNQLKGLLRLYKEEAQALGIYEDEEEE